MFLFDISLPSFHCMYPLCHLPITVLWTNVISSHVLLTEKVRLLYWSLRNSVEQAQLIWTECSKYRIRQFCASSRPPPPFFHLCVDHFLFVIHEFTLVFTLRSYETPPPPQKITVKPDMARFQVIAEVLLKTGGGFLFLGGGYITPYQQLRLRKFRTRCDTE